MVVQRMVPVIKKSLRFTKYTIFYLILVLFTHVILAATGELFAVQTAMFDNERLLQASNSKNDWYNLTCLSRGDIEDDSAPAILNRRTHPLQKFSKGKLALAAIEIIRPRDEQFYMDVLHNFIMAICDVKNNATVDRCVKIDSAEAAKDSNGTCIQASDSSCPQGYCERYSNCYWKSVVPGQPRQTRFLPEKYTVAKEALIGRTKESYIGGLLLPSLVGILVALLLLLIWIVFIVARYCCCCLWEACGICYLCSPTAREKRYNTCLELLTPMFVYAVCIAVIIFCGIMSLIGNLDISTATIDTFRHSNQLLQEIRLSFIGIQSNLMNLSIVATDTAFQAQNILNKTDFVRNDAVEIVSSFVDYESTYEQGLSELSNSSEFYEAYIGYSQQVRPVLDGVEHVIESLNENFNSTIESMESNVDWALDIANSFVNMTATYESTLINAQNTERVYRVPRQVASLAIFGVAFLLALVGFWGLLPVMSRQLQCCSIPCMAHTAWISCAIFGSIAIVLASALMLSNMVVLDACKMATLITQDLEPFLGESLAVAPNAIFHDTNILVAYDLLDKIDFPLELDNFLSTLSSVNISEEFSSVTNSLVDFDRTIESVSSNALILLNNLTNLNSDVCPFHDTYVISDIRTPWVSNRGKVGTGYVLNSTMGTNADGNWYIRASQNESGLDYLSRIYNIAGRCVSRNSSSSSTSMSCCIRNSTTKIPICNLNSGDWCTYGESCHNVCTDVTDAILHGYVHVLNSVDMVERMRSDLGVFCPNGQRCPTIQFQSMGHDSAILSNVDSFQLHFSNLSEMMLTMTGMSIREGKDAVEGLICLMNFSFVEKRYRQLHLDVCETFLGGIAQLHWFMWILALVLEIIAIIGSILIVRMKWHGEEEEKLYGFYKSNGRVRVRL